MQTKRITINDKDYTSFFAPKGLKVNYEIIKGSNAGRMLDGSYTEDELAQKAVITLKCKPLNEEQTAQLLDELLRDVYHTVEYYDPRTGDYRTMTAMRSISTQDYVGTCLGGDYWNGITITLTER